MHLIMMNLSLDGSMMDAMKNGTLGDNVYASTTVSELLNRWQGFP